jgi:hypothetical protein
MRFPERNSRGEKILQAFFARGPMTIYQGEEAHGSFATPSFPDGIEHERLVALYCDLVDRGCLIREGIKYRLSLAAQHRMEKAKSESEPLSIVPPRIRDFFAKPLRIGYSPGLPWRLAL